MPDKTELTSDEKELDAMYGLKKTIRNLRAGKRPAGIDDMFKYYADVVLIAGRQDGKSEEAVFDELMQPVKQELLQHFNKPFLSEITADSVLAAMVDSRIIDRINEKIGTLQKMAKSMASSPERSSGRKKAKTVEVKESQETECLRREFIAGIEARVKRGKLSPEDAAVIKEQLRQSPSFEITGVSKYYNKTSAIKIKAEGIDFSINTSLSILGCRTEDNKSTYGCLSPELMDEFSKVSRAKSYKTAIGLTAQKENARARAQTKKEADEDARVAALRDEIEQLAKQIGVDEQKMIENLNSRKLYELLTLDNAGGEKLLQTLFSGDDMSAFQDELRSRMIQTVVWDENVGRLYHKQKDENEKNDRPGYYDAQINSWQINAENQIMISREVAKLMSEDKPDKERCLAAVSAIAGTRLPVEIAKDILLQSVFEYGMGRNYYARFDENKFNKMNQVLDNFGYRIKLHRFTARNSCSQAKPVSEAVLNDMHKRGCNSIKNQKTALLLKIGEVLAKNGGKPLSHLDHSTIYNLFCQAYYNGNKMDHGKQFETFVSNNAEPAVKVYQTFKREAELTGKPDQLAAWIDTLAVGNNINKDQSVHHIYERRLAGVLGTEREKLHILFNTEGNLVECISFHWADDDPHRDEAHRFDMRETYLFINDRGQYRTGTMSQIKAGDTVLVPVTYCKNDKGIYKRVVEPDTLLMTSSGLTVREPVSEKPQQDNELAKIIIPYNPGTSSGKNLGR